MFFEVMGRHRRKNRRIITVSSTCVPYQQLASTVAGMLRRDDVQFTEVRLMTELEFLEFYRERSK